MKKYLLLALVVFLYACGEDADSSSSPAAAEIDEGYSSDEKSSSSVSKTSSSSASKHSSSSTSKDSSSSTSKNSSSSTSKNSSASTANSSSSEKDSVEIPEFSIKVENEEMSFDLSKMKMVDKRDGHEYPLKLSNSKLSMNANLNYETEGSWCYADYPKNCERYGRLYTWNEAYQDTRTNSCEPVDPKGICPKGWTVNHSGVRGIYAGYRDESGYYAYMNDVGWAWSPHSPKKKAGDALCDGEKANVHDYCEDLECYRQKIFPDYMPKGNALSVSCEYQWPVNVPDSVTLPNAEPIPTYRPKSLTLYTGKYGDLVDERDGNIYRTVDIGDQTWMAENLKYVIDSSFCMGGNEKDSCTKYAHLGRMYKWAQANGFESNSFDRTSVEWPIQGVCPNGWHIPTVEDWNTLFSYVVKTTDGAKINDALYATKWNEYTEGGSDAFGFGINSSGNKHYYSIVYDYSFGYVEYMISDKDQTPDLLVLFSYPGRGYDGRIFYDSENNKSYPHIRCVKGQGSNPIPPLDATE
ncbi:MULTISPECIES: FISUMP domain-containing protein [unclassified Fibrobacter]|uniref:FISUMP domain-containing protein n=1 Tax=unclassified Fibrobacter TaxID=2634177 RepID=UPI000D7B039E|nr:MULTISPECIES: FISUMP domain-containing protein [unclassified Fibrobacter]PWJ66246.1 uncharacterized protein (TIGR02145 family) [Fibrobacter sp. UWR4]PZW69450.1 uncharacterized protein (TIGR02145 family) [Fibrobacter sp. UWR1]